ncbi:MAG: DUF58 domain-containing protein [Imperialibacter sp.]|jgi:uncharacterized protein (DUF58 family)|uniref:DUF58 domain-containing protein n=1 Tax=Imperialibacter sp. TaxID=2038411 RepID=UPI0032F05406
MKVDFSKVKEYGGLEFLARQMVEGFITGMHKSPYHGFSVEFAEHRLYNTGESTRHIDWKVFARTDRIYTKRFEEETNLRCYIVLDHSSSMYYPEKTHGKIKFSALAAAALAYLLHKQRDAVGLFTFAEEIELQTQVKSTSSHIQKLFILLNELLESTPTLKKTNVAEVLHQVAEKIHKRSLVIIFSDMFQNYADHEQIFSALQHLKHNRHEVLMFHVTDKSTEIDFSFEDRPYEFMDLEGGEKIKLTPSQVKESYHKAVAEFASTLKLRCGQLKIDLVEADIQDDINKILTGYLIKRTKLN